MTDTASTSEPLPQRPRANVFRRVALPALVIAAIVAAIWLIEHERGATSPTGERYGPVTLPAVLRAPGLDVNAEEGALAPDFLLERLDAGELRLSDLRGQPIVLNFWATWCAPCRKEIPQLVAAYNRFAPDGLVIVGLNLQEGKGIVTPYAQDYGMKFPIAIDRDGEVGDKYHILGLPTTYFIDRHGVIRSIFIGPLLEKKSDTDVQGAIGEDELERRIAEIMAAEPVANGSSARSQ